MHIQKFFSSNSDSDRTNVLNEKQETELEEKERLRKVKEETREYLRQQGYKGKITIVTSENPKRESRKDNYAKNSEEKRSHNKNNYISKCNTTFDPIYYLNTYDSNTNNNCEQNDSNSCHTGSETE
ncbi:hypothetical protein [Bacillus sp. Brlt_9]|uniref:hypothetical protein n=1 Tax=Bacillus sp. Brlt_9 TaxID=3110916 RepID=UPI003F7C7B13